jgi:multicomponent Na+:H+ antiporter subunit D
VSVAITLLAPVLGAGLVALLPRGRRAAAALSIALATAAAAIAALWVAWRGGARSWRLAGPWDTEVVVLADGLALVLVLTTAVVGTAVVAVAAIDEARHTGGRATGDRAGARTRDAHDPRGDLPGAATAVTATVAANWPGWLGLWAAVQVLLVAGDLLTIYLALEVVGLLGAVLVAGGGDRPAVLAGTRYLAAELVASLTVLVGFALLWHATGAFALADVAAALAAAPSATAPGLAGPGLAGPALAVATLGLLLKVPLAPLHLWLPAAHSRAPGAVSPVLSGVVVTTATVVAVRLWVQTAPTALPPATAQLLGGLGVAAIVWGGVAALRATGTKRLLAYSTVSQLGQLWLLLPLARAGSADGVSGGLLHAVAHAPAKASMLLAAAVLAEDAGRDHVDALDGVASRRPLSVAAIGLAGVSLIGLPPTAGFAAKWQLLDASLATGQWWWAVAIAGGGLLTAAYVTRLLTPAFVPPDREPGPAGTPAAARRDAREVVALVLAATTLVLGLRPVEALTLLEVGAAAAGGTP